MKEYNADGCLRILDAAFKFSLKPKKTKAESMSDFEYANTRIFMIWCYIKEIDYELARDSITRRCVEE